MEDGVLKDVLIEEASRIQKIINIYKEELAELPKGYITTKNIKGKQYPYLQYRDGIKTKSIYIKGDDNLNELENKITRKKDLIQAIKRAESNLKSIERALR